MSSIYRADRGRIRVAGRLAPFIELGVGFNPEMTSRDNVVLNGVMMGLGRREAQRRLDGGARLRRPARVRRPQAQELLVGDDGPARVRGHGRGGRRHHARRRGARGRRRGVRAQVHGRLPGPAPGRPDARARHPRHGDGREHVRPRDAARGRRPRLRRRPAGDGAALLPRQLRPRALEPGPRPLRRRLGRQRHAGRRVARERRRRARREPRAGRADRPADRASRPAASWSRRSSASTSSTSAGTRSSASTAS